MRRLAFVLALSLAAPATGCSAFQAYFQRQAIQQAEFKLKSVALGGLDLTGANLVVTLELINPSNTSIVLDRLDYTLYVNDQRLLAGFTDQHTTVPPNDVRPVQFTTFVRYSDVGSQLRQAVTGGVASYRLEGVGHFDTPFGTFDYPLRLWGR